ncbi:sialidase family protein [Corynebacterium casei]|uniref:sialidase family protein n=1 Tax=Corynebacterium casei TaxID=160386 RepID=UPI003FD37BB4
MKRTKAALALPVALSMSFALNPIVASAQTLPEETSAQPSAEVEAETTAEVTEPEETGEESAESGDVVDAVDAAQAVAAVDGLEVRLEVTNPRQDGQAWKVGDEIRYSLVVDNDTGVGRAFETTGSNLDNWQPCRWTNMANGGGELECNTLSHVVTEEDLEAGSFTPTLDARLFETPGYTGENQDLDQIVGEEAIIAQAALDVDMDAEESEDSYGVGDTVEATLTIRNISDNDVISEVASEQDAADCQNLTIAVGEEANCVITHEVTQDDVELGYVELAAEVSALVDGEVVDIVSADARVGLNTSWDEATAFEHPDASISMDAKMSAGQLIMGFDSENNIRIPALAVASNGDLLASYDRRPLAGGFNGGDSPNANSIVQRRSSDNGVTWGPETVISQGKAGDDKIGFSDPSYVTDKNTGHIFNFHVQSFDSGVFHNNPAYTYNEDGSIDENHRNTMNLGMAVSKDNGRTWENRVITDEVLRGAGHDMMSGFATSGAGIQIEHDPHAGRLVQQYAWRMKDESIRATSVYSDDGGETWNLGEYAPATSVDGEELRYDENTIAELSDGSLLMSSRSNNGKRIFATSTNGGQTWENAYYEPAFNAESNPGSGWNPGNNNAELIRAFPNAEPGSAESKVLLYSFTQGTDRTLGTIAASCDDGKTWPVKRIFETGPSGYTTMAVQEDGSIGLLYESTSFNEVSYRNFSLAWLDGKLCGLAENEQGGDDNGDDAQPISSGSSNSSTGGSIVAALTAALAGGIVGVIGTIMTFINNPRALMQFLR